MPKNNGGIASLPESEETSDFMRSLTTEQGTPGFLEKTVSLDTPDMTGKELAADILLGFSPGLGTAMAARDLERARREDDRLGMSLASMGLIPVAGGVFRVANKARKIWSLAPPAQTTTSAKTSVSQLPAGTKKLVEEGIIQQGDIVLDLGSGRFGKSKKSVEEAGGRYYPWDPYQANEESAIEAFGKNFNETTRDVVAGGGADKVLSNNVLNVIEESAPRVLHVEQILDALKKGGQGFITVYEKAGTGVGQRTSKGFQANRKTDEFLEEVSEVVGNRGLVELVKMGPTKTIRVTKTSGS